jgi:arylsulfatase A
MRWLESGRDEEKPFFLYVAYHEPHEPIATAEEYSSMYSQFEDPSQRAYYGNITQMDTALGRLLTKLDELKLRDNTLVIFTSDNGPAQTRYHPYGSAGPLRTKKGFIYEGGIRVPGMARWPGHIDAGTEADIAVSGLDVLPTLCEVAGVDAPTDRTLDGVSMAPLLEGRSSSMKRSKPLFWQYNRALSDVKVAMREGDFKLLARLTTEPVRSPHITAESMAILKTAGLTDFELYDLSNDVGETEDLASQGGERFELLKAKLEAFYEDVQSDAPIWPSWEHQRYESGRIEWPDYKALRLPPKMK